MTEPEHLLVDVDIGYSTKMARHEESGDTGDLPSRCVVTLVERGELGRKSGTGWHVTTPAPKPAPTRSPDPLLPEGP